MAQQETEPKQEPAAPDGTGQEGTGQQPAAQEATGKHAATGDATGQATEKADPADASTEKAAPAEAPTEKAAAAEAPTEKAAPAEAPTAKAAPAEAPTEKAAPAEASTEKAAAAEAPTAKAAPAEAPTERTKAPGRDTSWAEPEPADTPHRRSVDVGELAWRTGNVLATVIRTLALLFALVLIVNVVLVLVGVNPANGVAQFVGLVANIVILGFRDLFVPVNPVVMLIVNSLIAAIFWVFVGELVSRVIRFLAARVK